MTGIPYIIIPNLTPALSLDGTELLEGVQAGVSVRLTARQIADLVGGGQGPPFFTATYPLVVDDTNLALGKFSLLLAKTTNYTILLADNLATFTNIGASGAVTFTLPAGATDTPGGYGQQYRFIVVAGQNLIVRANAGAIIALGQIPSSVGGTVNADGGAGGLYSTLDVQAVSSTLWIATNFNGAWSVA